MFTGLIQDIRYALRQLRKSYGFTSIAVVTLALGIGSNTAIFSNVNALILRPFGIPHLDRVMAIWETIPKADSTSVKAAPANFRDWTEQNNAFESLAAIHGWDANLTGAGRGRESRGVSASRPNSFRYSTSLHSWGEAWVQRTFKTELHLS